MKTIQAIQVAIVMVVVITMYLGFTHEAKLYDSDATMMKCKQEVQTQCEGERQRASNCEQIARDVCRALF